MMLNTSAVLIGGALGLVFLVALGFILSDVQVEIFEPSTEVEPISEVKPIIYDDRYVVEKFVAGLQYPTTMTFVGEDILVLEKNTGKVIRIQSNGAVYDQPVLDLPVAISGESGLLGITSTSNHVYLFFTESNTGNDDQMQANEDKNFVYQYDWDGENLVNPILIKKLPALSHSHHGGALAVGLNNEVYFVVGDQDQEIDTIDGNMYMSIGTIFKADTENNNSVKIFAMGIRNSFGLAVDPVTGYLWDTENGPDKFDEINLVEYGFISRHLSITGPISTAFELDSNIMYSDPEFSWYYAVGLTAIEFPDNDSFKRYSDWLFVGDFNNGRIYKFQLNTDRTGFVFSGNLSDLVYNSDDELGNIVFAESFPGGITDIEFHGGAMYVVSHIDGSIYKIYPNGNT